MDYSVEILLMKKHLEHQLWLHPVVQIFEGRNKPNSNTKKHLRQIKNASLMHVGSPSSPGSAEVRK